MTPWKQLGFETLAYIGLPDSSLWLPSFGGREAGSGVWESLKLVSVLTNPDALSCLFNSEILSSNREKLHPATTKFFQLPFPLQVVFDVSSFPPIRYAWKHFWGACLCAVYPGPVTPRNGLTPGIRVEVFSFVNINEICLFQECLPIPCSFLDVVVYTQLFTLAKTVAQTDPGGLSPRAPLASHHRATQKCEENEPSRHLTSGSGKILTQRGTWGWNSELLW